MCGQVNADERLKKRCGKPEMGRKGDPLHYVVVIPGDRRSDADRRSSPIRGVDMASGERSKFNSLGIPKPCCFFVNRQGYL